MIWNLVLVGRKESKWTISQNKVLCSKNMMSDNVSCSCSIIFWSFIFLWFSSCRWWLSIYPSSWKCVWHVGKNKLTASKCWIKATIRTDTLTYDSREIVRCVNYAPLCVTLCKIDQLSDQPLDGDALWFFFWSVTSVIKVRLTFPAS